MSRVTVLMAAYNSCRFVGKSIESMLRQTMTDWQLVCVDDASTDNTADILESFAQKDQRIEVVRLPKNGGIAKARNAGLSVATGEFVCMLDSDDWLSADALEKACQVFDEYPATDSVLFQVDEVYDDHVRRFPLPSVDFMTGEQAFQASLTWKIHGLYLIRASIHRQYPYDESSLHYSDENVTRIHYLRSREVRFCQGVYYYLQHESSVTHRVSVRRFDCLRANESMRQMLIEAQVSDMILANYEKVRWLNLVDAYLFYYKNRKSLSRDDCARGLKEMRHTWSTVHTEAVPLRLRAKFGYMPLRPFWWLFRCQEELYFSLRHLFGKN